MSCSIQYPLFFSDLTQSQYLSPIPSTSFDELAADIQVWNDYKTQIESKLAYSDVFRKQFLLFAEQFLYDIKRSQSYPALDASSNAFRNLLSSIGVDDGGATPATPPMGGETIQFTQEKVIPKPSVPCPRTKSLRRRRSKNLVDPPPRVSSPLSPHPSGTPLLGVEQRRPMPPKSRRHPNPRLLKVVLEGSAAYHFKRKKDDAESVRKSTGGRSKTSYRRLHQTYDGLGASWIVVSDDEWEMVTDNDDSVSVHFRFYTVHILTAFNRCPTMGRHRSPLLLLAIPYDLHLFIDPFRFHKHLFSGFDRDAT